MPLTPIQKYARQLRISDSFGKTLVEQRRAFAAPHRGIRLADAETVEQNIGAIRFFGGMDFLASVHAEIDAAKPVALKDEEDKWDNSPYKPDVKVNPKDIEGDDTEDEPTPKPRRKKKG